MTVARFSEDHDAKWIIGLSIFSIVLIIGGLLSIQPKPEKTSESSAVHATTEAPAK